MKIVPKLDDIRSFGILAFSNGLEYDFRRLMGNHFCTACENLVRLGIVTPEF